VFSYTTSGVTPVVSNLSVAHQSPPQGTTNGGDLITITGSNFYAGTQVNFLPEGAGSTVSATDVIVNTTGTQITAVTPGIIAGTLQNLGTSGNPYWVTYYLVQVVTPGGSSTTSVASTQYQYDLPVPVVSGIGANATNTSTSYVNTAGKPLGIVGTSFFAGASLQFQPITSGSCPTSGNGSYQTVSTSSITVSSPTSITTTVPNGLSNNCSYVVAVNTAAGTSSNAIDFKL
jgi:hypothetical protein